MPTLAELIRAKYGDAYKDLDDATLEQQVLAKHPEYADLAKKTDTDAASTATASPKDAPAESWGDTAMRAVKGVGHFVRDHPVESAATAGAMIAAPFTGGGSLALPAAATSIAAAGLGGAGGAGLGYLYKAIRGDADTPSSASDVLKGMGTEGAIQGASEGIGQAVAPVLKGAGAELYRRVLRPSLTERLLPRAGATVQTGLREGIPITASGAAKAGARIGDLNTSVGADLAGSSAKIPIDPVTGAVRKFALKYNVPGVPPEDYEAAMKVADDFANHPQFGAGAGRVTAVKPTIMNSLKKSADDAIGNASFGVTRGAETEARKALRTAERDALVSAVPEIAPKLSRESKLIDLRDAVTKTAGREANRSLTSIPNLISAGVGGSEYARHGSTLDSVGEMLATRAMLSPAVLSRLAIMLARGGRLAKPSLVGGAARGAYLTSLQDDQPPE